MLRFLGCLYFFFTVYRLCISVQRLWWRIDFLYFLWIVSGHECKICLHLLPAHWTHELVAHTFLYHIFTDHSQCH